MPPNKSTNFSKKNDPNTVFLRYSPPSAALSRHHLETICSEVGPVKKCSLIKKKGKQAGFAFVKFTTEQDARDAVQALHQKMVTIEAVQSSQGGAAGEINTTDGSSSTMEATKIRLLVELASDEAKDDTNSGREKAGVKRKKQQQQQQQKEDETKEETELSTLVVEKAAGENNNEDKQDHEKSDESKKEESTKRAVPALPETTTHALSHHALSPEEEMLQKRKRTSRVMLRNLSFYANANDIKKTIEAAFGSVLEINLPMVPSGHPKAKKQHRGFAFVTFENAAHAKKAVDQGTVEIKKRQVAMDYSVSKLQHKQQQKEREAQESRERAKNQEKLTEEDEVEEEDEEMKEVDDDDSSSAPPSDDSDSDSDSDDDDGNSRDSNKAPQKKTKPDVEADNKKAEAMAAAQQATKQSEMAIKQNRTLFLRNLPYDVTRHDLFQLFAPYGTISSLYIVKDVVTGIQKGTAFLEYRHGDFAQKALTASGDAEGQDATAVEGITLQGRRIFCNLAVDKATATSIQQTSSQNSKRTVGRDRRNLYLKNEGRVTDEDAWENELLESDKGKRGRAHNEKSQKLRSPLFFINAHRLSLRNLAKHITEESQLRTLVVEGLQRGLQRKVVTKEDMWMQQKAKGDGIEGISELTVPPFDDKEIKSSIPSIYVDRDEVTAASKGFAFVEFTHHAHALACLRELNNNPRYSKEYATGGKKVASTSTKKSDASSAAEEKKVPRLIVEFTVENKAKAKLQADRRARQLANVTTQRMNSRLQQREDNKNNNKNKNSPKQKKKSRGALQREKKRKLREQQEEEGNNNDTNNGVSSSSSTQKEVRVSAQKKEQVEMLKPPKSKKLKVVDKEEEAFEKMVQSYKATFMGGVPSTEKKQEGDTNNASVSVIPDARESVKKGRWFD